MPQTTRTIISLNEAALAIAEGLSLPRTLQQIADTARELVQTRYAALGVIDESHDDYRLKQFITSGVEPHIARHISHEPTGRGLLGDIFRGGRAIRLDDIGHDHRSIGFPEGHPPMHSFLGMPIINRGRNLGNLYLTDRLDGQPFDDADEEVVALLAAHAAIAIENARLHEELQTIALRSERDRIGMELHDGVIQSIYAVGMKLDILRGQLTNQLGDDQAEQFQFILEDLDQIIEDIRSYIRNLLSARDEQSTLRQKIENIALHFRDFSGVQVQLEIADRLPILSDYQRHNLLQILREVLSNTARHAAANEVHISISEDKRYLTMIVTDDGCGFDYVEVDQHDTMSFGLKNIEQRARRLGGDVTFSTGDGLGTTVALRFSIELGFNAE